MKKVLSMLLAIIMVFSLLPISAFAAETGGKITFTTDFTNDLGVGDTFTVTATLSENPGIASFTNQFKWNEAVVEFLGFKEEYDEDEEADVIVSDIFTASGWTFETNLNGTFTAARVNNRTKNGVLYVGEFKIIAEEGELGLGLTTTEFGQKFTFADSDGNDIMPELDFSAISGLTVGGKPVGPEMPEDAPFTAITTDAGPIVAIEEADWIDGVPYYIVTIPADAETAYVTAPDQVVMEDWTTGQLQATAYASDLSFSSEPLYISYNYEDTADGPKVEIPMNMWASDWSGEVELDFINTHAFGIEDANYACLGWISFVYDDGLEEYNISIDENMVGGTIYACDEDGNEITKAKAGETVFVEVEADEGYTTTGAYYINGQIANDFMFVMPEEDVILTATFQKQHTHVYDKEVAADKYLKDAATCQSGAVYYKSCECGEFVDTADTFVSGEPVDHHYVDGKCEWCGTAEPVIAAGYTVTMPEDIEIVNGENVSIPVVIGYSGNVEKYNAFDFTFAYDPAVLELTSTKINDMTVEVENGVIHVVRYGTEQALGTALTLTFNALATGEADVKLTSAKVDISASALGSDAPDATIIDDTTAVKVTGYTATLPEEFNGSETVIPGADYTFSANDLNYDYVVTATINGEEVKVIDNGDGTYTIQAEDITGDIVITMTKTGKKFDVTLGEDMDGAEEAQYMTDYEATLTKEAGYGYKITVTIGGTEYTGFIYNEETGILTIPGKDITGEVVIDSGKEAGEFSVTFEGNGAGDAEGDAVAEGGKSYSFTLNMADGYDYTVTATMDGEAVELSESESIYTIEKVTGNIVITIEKTSDLEVEVKEYVTLNDKTVFLVTATQTLAEDEALSYDGTVMFWSEQYKAWAFLVITEDTLSAEDAKTLITNGKAEYTTLTQTLDVNGTNKVDINDAQLVFDLYNNVYQDFTVATMVKFLKADVNGDKNIDVSDASAVVAEIMK